MDSNWVKNMDEVNGSSTDLGKVINHIKLNEDLISAAVIISDKFWDNYQKNLNIKIQLYFKGEIKHLSRYSNSINKVPPHFIRRRH